MKIQLASSSDECLRTEALAVVTPVPRDLMIVIEDMTRYMTMCNAVGVAAPQFGVPFRVFVARLIVTSGTSGRNVDHSNVVMVNPVVVAEEGSQTGYEGCLSFPGIQARVSRPQKIEVTWDNVDGERYQGYFTGDNARVIMHEYDHLRGIVFLDHIKGFKQFTQRDTR